MRAGIAPSNHPGKFILGKTGCNGRDCPLFFLTICVSVVEGYCRIHEPVIAPPTLGMPGILGSLVVGPT
jgi:hypothetical protein